ncbi:hypothetical protein [Brevibacillus dissolubilis]|uniref:hypothetical protein n=1 Tax=Brevibacillus dissolubilis TaxID=1844116 RepID=UPI0011161F35|nr:hypothetical protein [Brevibacillus dissolubilis]
MWMSLFVSLMLVFTSPITDQPNQRPGAPEQIELFDTDQERIVQRLESTPQYQQEVRKILDSVTGRVQELNPSLRKAMILKIPVKPPQRLRFAQANLDTEIIRMFIVMPKPGNPRKPYLLLHNRNNETILMEFNRPLTSLMNLLHNRR